MPKSLELQRKKDLLFGPRIAGKETEATWTQPNRPILATVSGGVR
jgi:hypothetical protein